MGFQQNSLIDILESKVLLICTRVVDIGLQFNMFATTYNGFLLAFINVNVQNRWLIETVQVIEKYTIDMLK